MPPTIADRAPRPGDERFVTLTGRRPVVEHVVAHAAQDEPRVDVRRGVGVQALVARRMNGTAHVEGVRTDTGDELRSDLVVDATGRRSPLGRWLADAGAPPLHEEAEDSGFIYYTRFFRARESGSRPEFRAAPLTVLEAFSVLTLPADNDTWSVTLYIDAGDRALKALRHPDRWDAVLAACPRHAQWADGEPITDVMAMRGIMDRYRRLAPAGQAVATGVAATADAWAATNPSAGRGITMGAHARPGAARRRARAPRRPARVRGRAGRADRARHHAVVPHHRGRGPRAPAWRRSTRSWPAPGSPTGCSS